MPFKLVRNKVELNQVDGFVVLNNTQSVKLTQFEKEMINLFPVLDEEIIV